MSIELKAGDAVGMGTFWLRLTANRLEVFAWIEDHFEDAKVQAVVDFAGKRDTDYCSDYYDLLVKIQEKVEFFETGSSQAQHETIQLISAFILLKAERAKDVRAQIKRDKIAQLQKEIAELEGPSA